MSNKPKSPVTKPPTFMSYVARKTLAHTVIAMAAAAAYLVPNQLVAANAELRTLVSPHSTTARHLPSSTIGSDLLAEKMRQGGCRNTALPGNVEPGSALVLDQDVNRADLAEVASRARFSSFEEGWAIHQGDKPGTVLAFCASHRP